MRRLLVLGFGALALIAQAAPAAGTAGPPRSARAGDGPGDATVVAVIDFNFVPYHWDFLASKMPQATDSDEGNDLPLDRAPHKWLPGFPSPTRAFKSYNRFDLTLEEKDEDAPIVALDAGDKAKWDKVERSAGKKPHYYWFPQTKVIGAIEFGNNQLHGDTRDHGAGVTSVSVGNIHGTCPECLLVFINADGGNKAKAIRWAMKQSWIDVVTNSYGRSTFMVGKTYHGPDVEDQKEASERGQRIFFSAGNGIENAFTVPNSTYLSSEKGPDWVITVGAVSPGENNPYDDAIPRTSSHASYIGHGKPADVAGIGLDYPSAYSSNTVSETGRSGFSGTSNAAPTIAGTYARALYLARRDLSGPSRIQKNGLIATGGGFECGRAWPDCELGDGKLTADELQTRLLLGAQHTDAGVTTYAGGELAPVGEDEFLNEGHGTYFARESGKVKDWVEEFERVLAPLEGRAKPVKRPPGEREWMVVDSFCRQHIWGAWTGGYYREGKAELPGIDASYPLRSMLEVTCPLLLPPP